MAANEDAKIIRPLPFSFKYGAISRAHKKTPLTFTLNTSSHLSTDVSSILLAFRIPALATKTSTVPYFLIVLSIAVLTCFSLLTSHLIISGF